MMVVNKAKNKICAWVSRIRKCKPGTVIFLIAYVLFLFGAIHSQTEFQKTYGAVFADLCQWCAMFLLGIKIAVDGRLDFCNVAVWAAFMLFNLLISFTTGNYNIILPIAAFMCTASNVEDRHIVKAAFYILAVMMILTILCSMIGIIPFRAITQWGDRDRYALGFVYVTFSANYFFHALMMWLFLKGKCPNVVETVLIVLLNCVIYYFTDTRAVFYEVFLLLAVCWIFKYLRHGDRIPLRQFFLTAFLWGAAISFGLHVFYSPGIGWMSRLNSLLSGRLSLGHRAFTEYGFTLFGQPIQWNSFDSTGDYFYVDSSFMNVAVNYGVVLLALLIAGFTLLMRKYLEAGRLYCCIALLFIAIHAITDPQLYSMICNPFLFLLGGFFPLTPVFRRNLQALNRPLYRTCVGRV